MPGGVIQAFLPVLHFLPFFISSRRKNRQECLYHPAMFLLEFFRSSSNMRAS